MNSSTDYYPYGLVMRETKDEPYRFGYQGQFAEMDSTTSWNHFELRQYDSRIGRWLVTDPYRQFYSPYVGMGNNPVSYTDRDGGCVGPDCAPIASIGDCQCSTVDALGIRTTWVSSFDEAVGLGLENFEGGWLSGVDIVARDFFVAKAVRLGQRDFVFNSLDLARYTFGRVGAGVTFVGFALTPFVPPVGAGLIGVGETFSGIAGVSSAILNTSQGNYGAAATDAFLLGVGSFGSNGLKSLEGKGILGSTDEAILQGVLNTSLGITGQLVVPALQDSNKGN